MDSCQGLPDRPWPDSRYDATVPNTIHELFLCRQCELKRDAAKSTASSAVCCGRVSLGLPDTQYAADLAAAVIVSGDQPVKTLGSAGCLEVHWHRQQWCSR
jgi:hypothetical protein